MAAAMGIRTGRIDALTFGLGSALPALRAWRFRKSTMSAPIWGKSYIIDSFMVVVFGGVGNLWGTLVGAFTLGIANKFLEPFAGAVLGKITILVLIHPVHPEASARAVRPQGPGGGSVTPFPLIRAMDRGTIIFVVLLAVIAVLVPGAQPRGAADLAVQCIDLLRRAVRQVHLLRAAWPWRSI